MSYRTDICNKVFVVFLFPFSDYGESYTFTENNRLLLLFDNQYCLHYFYHGLWRLCMARLRWRIASVGLDKHSSQREKYGPTDSMSERNWKFRNRILRNIRAGVGVRGIFCGRPSAGVEERDIPYHCFTPLCFLPCLL